MIFSWVGLFFLSTLNKDIVKSINAFGNFSLFRGSFEILFAEISFFFSMSFSIFSPTAELTRIKWELAREQRVQQHSRTVQVGFAVQRTPGNGLRGPEIEVVVDEPLVQFESFFVDQSHPSQMQLFSVENQVGHVEVVVADAH